MKSDDNSPKFATWMQTCLNYAYIFVRGFVLPYLIYPLAAALIGLLAVYAFEIECRKACGLFLAMLLIFLICLIGLFIWRIRVQGRSQKRLTKEHPMSQLSDQKDKK